MLCVRRVSRVFGPVVFYIYDACALPLIECFASHFVFSCHFNIASIFIDEPTNYLDREALGALSSALNDWGGAVLMISHNK